MTSLMKCSALLFLYLGLVTSLQTTSDNLLRNTQRNLLRLIVDTRIHQHVNPANSLACFEYYLPLFEKLNEDYKDNYAACLATAADNRSQIDNSTKPERNSIESSSKLSCSALKECSQLEGFIHYFDCFVKSGQQNSEVMYVISANATETLAEVRERYRLIDNNEYRCTNASERLYIAQNYQANLDLQSCLRGDSTPPVPTTEAPETTTTTEEASTEAPETTTTTEEISSEAPETTPAPIESTPEEPSTIYSTPSTEDSDTTEISSTASNSDGYNDEVLPEEDLFALSGHRNVRNFLRRQ